MKTLGFAPVPWSGRDIADKPAEFPRDETPAVGPYCGSRWRSYECTMPPDHDGVTHRAGAGHFIVAEWADSTD